jgi:hypothetical protein
MACCSYIVNRGNKGGLPLFNADVPNNVAANNDLANAGDGFMQRKGYTIVWLAGRRTLRREPIA